MLIRMKFAYRSRGEPACKAGRAHVLDYRPQQVRAGRRPTASPTDLLGRREIPFVAWCMRVFTAFKDNTCVTLELMQRLPGRFGGLMRFFKRAAVNVP
jgi:hypothetical protein